MSVLEGNPADIFNAGAPLDLDWICRIGLDAGYIERAAADVAARTIVTQRSQKDLLLAVALMDLTTLADDDTDDRVRKLCARARQPLPASLMERLGGTAQNLQTAAVCICQQFVATALQELQGTGIRVATVSADFPKGVAPLEERIAQIHRSVEAGAHEIDVVIKREHVLQGDW